MPSSVSSHVHFEDGKARSVTVIRSSSIKQVGGGLDGVQAYHVLTEHLDVYNLGVWRKASVNIPRYMPVILSETNCIPFPIVCSLALVERSVVRGSLQATFLAVLAVGEMGSAFAKIQHKRASRGGKARPAPRKSWGLPLRWFEAGATSSTS